MLEIPESLQDHIESDDPHNQYILKRDLIEGKVAVSDFLRYVRNTAELQNHTTIEDNYLANATVINSIFQNVTNISNSVNTHSIAIRELETSLSNIDGTLLNCRNCVTENSEKINQIHNSDNENPGLLDIHRKRYTQDDALGIDPNSLTDHLDITGNNLYAARTHKHDNVYSKVNHKHLYSDIIGIPETPSLDKFVSYSSLSKLGLFDNSVNVQNELFYNKEYQFSNDCNDYLIQGSYYISKETNALNTPPRETCGFLEVKASYNNSKTSGTVTQFFYSENMSWKRFITVYPTYGLEVCVNKKFGKWTPLVETQPIGSLLFSNRNNVPKGYLEANGAIINSLAYPELWKFALENGVLHISDNNIQDGCFQLASFIDYHTLTINGSHIGDYIVDDNDRLMQLTNENIDTYFNRTMRLYSKEYLSNSIDFKLPNLNGNFMRMWTCLSQRSYGFNENDGLPNITGLIDTYSSVENARGAFKPGIVDSNNNKLYGQTQGNRTSVSYDESSYDFIEFNASESNSIYGKSNSVVPKNISVRVFIKAYNGSLLGQDIDRKNVRDIISSLLTDFSYASSSSTGFVKLATNDVINGLVDEEPNQPSVITASQLNTKDSTNIKKINVNGIEYIPKNNLVTLPKLAEAEGNRLFITTPNTLKCMYTFNALSISDTYADYIVPDYITARLGDNPNLGITSVSYLLKCESDSNSLGYPIGAIVSDPMCSIKINNFTEYFGSPRITIFRNNDTNIVIRLYWPNLWYIPAFTPLGKKGMEVFPVTAEDLSTYTEEQKKAAIFAECKYWSLILKIAL